jgi:hypothetical protein
MAKVRFTPRSAAVANAHKTKTMRSTKRAGFESAMKASAPRKRIATTPVVSRSQNLMTARLFKPGQFAKKDSIPAFTGHKYLDKMSNSYDHILKKHGISTIPPDLTKPKKKSSKKTPKSSGITKHKKKKSKKSKSKRKQFKVKLECGSAIEKQKKVNKQHAKSGSSVREEYTPEQMSRCNKWYAPRTLKETDKRAQYAIMVRRPKKHSKK